MASTRRRTLLPVACPSCLRPVLRVALGQTDVLIESFEIECPRMPCPNCLQRKVPNPDCLRCFGTGKVGDPTPQAAIGVTDKGLARAWHRGLARLEGEALHRRHLC